MQSLARLSQIICDDWLNPGSGRRFAGSIARPSLPTQWWQKNNSSGSYFRFISKGRPGGAIEAALELKKAGKIRYIGFTGHKGPDIHLRMLQVADEHQFRFDSVQMPLNVMDAHYESFEKKVLPVLVKNQIGVLAMKPMGDHFILDTRAVTATECLHYAMNLPTSTVITGCDSMRILDQVLSAARSFRPLTEAEAQAILAKTARLAQQGKHELYKTSHHFDGTYQNPQWLG